MCSIDPRDHFTDTSPCFSVFPKNLGHNVFSLPASLRYLNDSSLGNVCPKFGRESRGSSRNNVGDYFFFFFFISTLVDTCAHTLCIIIIMFYL